ncbi:flagellar protein FlaJ [Methanomicrobium sp. W14]|uniref:type II secretion system F family protein n=1 Tax=Methanomicrobium sp. W14 TaxID=2817839 RepID=UPI001AE17FF1|nr:type II secretion system F family protein [Methanomicrobium sp. W14]MBP2133140.1 flagellar protein FlaJ [Methanomicrobium sp. W14]
MADSEGFIDSILNNRQLSLYLKSAHIKTQVNQYMMAAVLLSVLPFFAAMMTGVILYTFDVNPGLLPPVPDPLVIAGGGVVISALIFLGFYYYPQLEASGRKNSIDMDLAYAVTYMQALSSTLPLYDIFRSVYEADDLYGEVSKECGIIVRNVEVFGEDLLSAMEYVISVTPSERFKELINDLMLVYRSGGNLKNFFNAKSESYREIAKQELEALLQFLEMIAEIYVTAFVAGPIAIIIMLVAQNLSGQNQLNGIMPLLYFGLPLGAIALIFVLYVLLPPDNLDISRKEIKDIEFGQDLLEPDDKTELDKKFLKDFNNRKQVLKLLDIIRHPVKFYISDYNIGITLGCIAAVLVFFAYYTGYIALIIPQYTTETFICLMIIAGIFPVMLAYEIRSKYVKNVERQLPEFLREISDMRDIGMTLQSAIKMISASKAGVLSSEIRIVSDELSYGSSLSGALVRMEERIGLVSVKRAISLLVKASEVTDAIREILAIAISDLEHYLRMKSKRFNVSFVYLAVIYLSFGIYLYSAYQMNVAFISSFSDFNLNLDISSSKAGMFHIGIILGFFSGIMAGQLSSNSIYAGLKHSALLLTATIITFVYLI